MEALGIGDLHMSDSAGLGGLSKYLENHDEMVISELTKVTDYARTKGVQTIIQYGDVCDSPRMSYRAMVLLSQFLSQNDDLKFHIILGNHDMYGETSETGHSLEVLKLLYHKPNVRFYLKPKTVEIDGAKVRFLPYPHESFDKQALNVYHKEVYGCMNDSGMVHHTEGLTKSKAIVVAGHIHTAHRVRNTYYSGTLYQTNFGESLPKYFHHIEFNSPQDYEVTKITHAPTYKLHTIVLQSRADLKLIPEGATNLVKLVIQDGADVTASDYANRQNIEIVKPFKNKEELQAVLTEDLVEGQKIIIRTEAFFKQWIMSLDVEREMRDRIRQVRQRVLTSVGA